MTTDLEGNVIVAGYFYTTKLAFGSDTIKNNGNYDFYVAKYDSTGTLLWTKSGGGIYDDVALGLTSDSAGNIFVTGYFYSPSLTAGNFTLTNFGVGDAFVGKYDKSGNLIWIKNIGGNNDDSSNGITSDTAGNLFITGFYQSSTLTIGSFTFSNNGGEDIFVVKMDNGGNVLWAKDFEGQGNDRGNGIAIDPVGNVFVTGLFFSSPLVLGADSLTPAGSSDIFVMKLNGQGTVLWSRKAGGIYNDVGYNITTDGNGNAIAIGTFISPTLSVGQFSLSNNGNFDFFTVSFNGNGAINWANSEGSLLDDTAYGVATNGYGNVYVTGHFHSPSIILGTDTLNNAGIGDFYILCYDGSGNTRWSEKIGGAADDGSSGLAVDFLGDLVVSGYFISPTISCPQFTLTNSGSEDIFIGKLRLERPSTVGLEKNAVNHQMTLFPNPSSGRFAIFTGDQLIIEIEILNELGERIYLDSDLRNQAVTVNLSTHKSGLYLVRVVTNKGVFVKKAILQ